MDIRIRKAGAFIMCLIICICTFAVFTTDIYAASGSVKINKKNFPNKRFRKYVKRKFDKNKNGVLSRSEIKKIKKINGVKFKGSSKLPLKSLKGIEYFTELEYLKITFSDIKKLNLKRNKKLKTLIFRCSECTSLDLSKNRKLKKADLELNTYLKTLKLGNNKALKYLNCSLTKVKTLNLTQAKALKVLYCSGCRINRLNVTNSPNLQVLSCNVNKIKTLDLSKNSRLKRLDCSDNRLEKLDLRQNPDLTELYCNDNKLNELDISTNTKLSILYCYHNNISELNIIDCPNLIKAYNGVKWTWPGNFYQYTDGEDYSTIDCNQIYLDIDVEIVSN